MRTFVPDPLTARLSRIPSGMCEEVHSSRVACQTFGVTCQPSDTIMGNSHIEIAGLMS